jgi:hypothetical protein
MMNQFSDLTDEQVFQLTDEQINFYIDLECAKEGVLLLPEEVPDMPVLVKPAFDATVYQVGEFFVKTPEEAALILDALNNCKLVKLDYESETGYESKYIKMKDSEEQVKPIRCYSPGTFAEIRTALKEFTVAKNKYEHAIKEYRDISEKRRNVSKWIMERVSEVSDKHYATERMGNEFNRYLVLSNGDTQIARNFLKNAYDLTDEEVAIFGSDK